MFGFNQRIAYQKKPIVRGVILMLVRLNLFQCLSAFHGHFKLGSKITNSGDANSGVRRKNNFMWATNCYGNI